MTDPRINNCPRFWLNYSMAVRPGDHVAIIASPIAEPLIKEVFRDTLRAGGHPYPFMGLELLRGMDGFDEILFNEGSDDQIQHVSRVDTMILTQFECMLSIRSQRNTHALSGIDPSRQVMWRKARSAIMECLL